LRAEDWRESKEEKVFFDLDLAAIGSKTSAIQLTQFYRESVHRIRVENPNSVVFTIRGQPHIKILMECKSAEEANRELVRLGQFLERPTS
jgi:hypothetical protein